MDKLAQFISIIFHPILLPTWMFLTFIVSGLCENTFIRTDLCFTIVFMTTFIFPVISLLILKKIKVIESFTMEKREERFTPLFIMVIFLYATNRFFDGISTLTIYNFYLTCNLLLCIVVFWINLYWKISMHGIGWGALSAMLLLLSTISSNIFLPYFIISIVLSGIVGFSRIYLKSHNEAQVYTGYAVGFLLVFCLWSLLM